MSTEITKTFLPLHRWEQALEFKEHQVIQLAEQGQLVVYDYEHNFMHPVHCEILGWILESVSDDAIVN